MPGTLLQAQPVISQPGHQGGRERTKLEMSLASRLTGSFWFGMERMSEPVGCLGCTGQGLRERAVGFGDRPRM